MAITAVNNFVLLQRDESKSETNGLIIPTSARQKMHIGTIISVGELSKDKKIKPGKRAMFHQTVGFTIEHEGTEYLVLLDNEIIAVL